MTSPISAPAMATCGDCGKEFAQKDAYVCPQTPGLNPPIGTGAWPATAYCPTCGALVADGNIFGWTGASAAVNEEDCEIPGMLNADRREIPLGYTPLHEERRLDVAGVLEFERMIEQRGGHRASPPAADAIANEAIGLVRGGDVRAATAKLDEAVAVGLNTGYQAHLLGDWGVEVVGNADRDDLATIESGLELCQRSVDLYKGASWGAPYVLSLLYRARGDVSIADALLADARRSAFTKWWVDSYAWTLNDRVSRWVAAYPDREIPASPPPPTVAPTAPTTPPPTLVRTAPPAQTLKKALGIGEMVYSIGLIDDRQVLAVYGDGTLGLWDLVSGQLVNELEPRGTTRVAVSTDGRRAVTGSQEGEITRWDPGTGECLVMDRTHKGFAGAAAMGADGRQAVTGAIDHTVRLWDLDQGRIIKRFEVDSEVGAIAYSFRTGRVIFNGDGGPLHVLNVATSEELPDLVGHKIGVLAVAISADGRRALSGGYDDTVRLWDVDEAEELLVMSHADSVGSVALTANGRLGVSGSRDNLIKVWDLSTGIEVARFEGHGKVVNSLALTSDNKKLVSGSADGTIRVWDMPQVEDVPVAEDTPEPESVNDAESELVREIRAGLESKLGGSANADAAVLLELLDEYVKGRRGS